MHARGLAPSDSAGAATWAVYSYRLKVAAAGRGRVPMEPVIARCDLPDCPRDSLAGRVGGHALYGVVAPACSSK